MPALFFEEVIIMGARKVQEQKVKVLGHEYELEYIDHGFNLELPGVETHLKTNDEIYTRDTRRIGIYDLVLRNNENEANFQAGMTYIKTLFPGKETRSRLDGELSTIGTSSGLSTDGYILIDTYTDVMIGMPTFFQRWYNIWLYSVAAEMAAEKGINFTVSIGESEPRFNKELNRIEINDPYLSANNNTKEFLKSIEDILNSI